VKKPPREHLRRARHRPAEEGLPRVLALPGELAIMRSVKLALDPKNLMNPGKIFDL
jgi:FAD/FMN-containing dehydrogenase